MATTELGRASYKAYRLLGITKVVASGEKPNLLDKVDLIQLPFLITPPLYALVFIKHEISLPAVTPFTYTEDIPFPTTAKEIVIQDANDWHHVPIVEVVPPVEAAATGVPKTGDFCVYSGFGINPLMIASCGAPLPAGYDKVFGPSAYSNCVEYVKSHGGIAE